MQEMPTSAVQTHQPMTNQGKQMEKEFFADPKKAAWAASFLGHVGRVAVVVAASRCDPRWWSLVAGTQDAPGHGLTHSHLLGGGHVE